MAVKEQSLYKVWDGEKLNTNNIDFLRDCLEQFTVIQCLNNCQTGTCFSNINP